VQLWYVCNSVVDPKDFFSDSDPDIFWPDSDSKTSTGILTRQKSGSQSFRMYSGTCKSDKKFCYRNKIHFVLTSDFDELFLFYNNI
jgi:hypothetical protein